MCWRLADQAVASVTEDGAGGPLEPNRDMQQLVGQAELDSAPRGDEVRRAAARRLDVGLRVPTFSGHNEATSHLSDYDDKWVSAVTALHVHHETRMIDEEALHVLYHHAVCYAGRKSRGGSLPVRIDLRCAT